MLDCEFCKKELDITQEIVRTLLVKVIYPQRPVVESYILIMPIRHCKNVHDLTSGEFFDILEIVKKFQVIFAKLFGIKGYNLFVNNGSVAGQYVPHVHFHMIGRLSSEIISPFEILNNPELRAGLKRLTQLEMDERKRSIKNEFEKL